MIDFYRPTSDANVVLWYSVKAPSAMPTWLPSAAAPTPTAPAPPTPTVAPSSGAPNPRHLKGVPPFFNVVESSMAVSQAATATASLEHAPSPSAAAPTFTTATNHRPGLKCSTGMPAAGPRLVHGGGRGALRCVGRRRPPSHTSAQMAAAVALGTGGDAQRRPWWHWGVAAVGAKGRGGACTHRRRHGEAAAAVSRGEAG
jgi:hypothetical protein